MVMRAPLKIIKLFIESGCRLNERTYAKDQSVLALYLSYHKKIDAALIELMWESDLALLHPEQLKRIQHIIIKLTIDRKVENIMKFLKVKPIKKWK
jgi:hypothetical protein